MLVVALLVIPAVVLDETRKGSAVGADAWWPARSSFAAYLSAD
jgi:hypothetical protein